MARKAEPRSLGEIADFVNGRVIGDPQARIAGLASIESAKPGDLTFLDDQKGFETALRSPASAVIVSGVAELPTYSKPLLLSAHPRLAFARAAQLLFPPALRAACVHGSAIVGSSAKVPRNVTIEARVVVCENAEIGEGTRVGAGSVIGENVKLGCECVIYPNVTIYPGVRIGNRVIVHAGAVLGSDGFGYVRDPGTGRYEKFPQIGRLEIEDDVEIGANCTIDRGALDVTRIGRGTKLDNLVHIGHNCQIGENVVLAAQTGLSGSVIIEKDVVSGGQAGIGERARIEEGVLLGGQAGVLPHKVLRGKGVAFWGTPAKPLREYLKQLAAMARLAKKD